MIGNFNVSIGSAQFEFHTMNVQRLQLFQVYVLYEGKKVRFHMQRKGDGDFFITDIEHCPEPYRNLETDLNAAILEYAANAGLQ